MRKEDGDSSQLGMKKELGEVGNGIKLEQAGFDQQQSKIGLSQPIDRPSGLGAVLGGIQSGLSGYRTGLDIGSRLPTKSTETA